MTLPVLLSPNTDLVAVAWLRRIPKVADYGVGVATSLPADDAPLRERGFIRVTVVGGTPDLYVPLRRPIVAAECFAAPAEGSSKVPWARAGQLAEWVWESTYDGAMRDLPLDMPQDGYGRARVLTVSALTEPRRVPGDEAGYARFDVELELNWTGV